tara:strand:- start:2734 stop:2952 length:219 start_codon:yes stop_codon:yes gene_type:complete
MSGREDIRSNLNPELLSVVDLLCFFRSYPVPIYLVFKRKPSDGGREEEVEEKEEKRKHYWIEQAYLPHKFRV